MRWAHVATLALLCLLPASAAQAPTPEDVILQACAAARGLDAPHLSICPRVDPAPAPVADEPPVPAPPAPSPPARARALVDDAAGTVASVPADPAGAPARLVALVERIRAFLEDLVAVPGGLASEAGARVAEAVDAARASAASAAGSVADSIRALLDGFAREPALPASAPARVAAAPRVDATLQLPLRELREVLPEG